MADPQQVDSSALARQFGGTPSATLAAQFGGTPSAGAAPPVSAASTQPSSGSPVTEGVGEFFSQFNPVAIAKSILPQNEAEAAGGPVASLVGRAWDAAKARWAQARQADADGDPAQAAIHVAGAIPFIGPGLDKVATGIKTKDSTLLAQGLGDLAALGVSFTGDVTGAPIKAAEGAADTIAEGAGRASTQQMVGAIAPKGASGAKVRLANTAAEVAPSIARMDDMGALSRPALFEKIDDQFDIAKGILDDASDARNKGAAIPTQPILDALKAARDRLTAQPVEGSLPQRVTSTRDSPIVDAQGKPIQVTTQTAQPIGQPVVEQANQPRVDRINAVIDEIQKLGPVARYDSLKTLRSALDSEAKVVYNPATVPDFLAKRGTAYGAADGADAIRTTLAQADPASAAANGNYSFWKSANDVAKATAETEQAKPGVLRSVMAPVIGGLMTEGLGMSGTSGVVLGVVLNEASKAGYTTKIAISRQLARLSDAMRAGNAGAARSAMVVLSALTGQLPKLNQTLGEPAAPAPRAISAGTPINVARAGGGQ